MTLTSSPSPLTGTSPVFRTTTGSPTTALVRAVTFFFPFRSV
ncbi:hypothetical protein [Streptomyces sp. NPDC101776]